MKFTSQERAVAKYDVGFIVRGIIGLLPLANRYGENHPFSTPSKRSVVSVETGTIEMMEITEIV